MLTRVVGAREAKTRLVAQTTRESSGGAYCRLRRRRIRERERRSRRERAVVRDDYVHTSTVCRV